MNKIKYYNKEKQRVIREITEPNNVQKKIAELNVNSKTTVSDFQSEKSNQPSVEKTNPSIKGETNQPIKEEINQPIKEETNQPTKIEKHWKWW